MIVSNYMPDRIKVDLKEVSTRQRCGAETPLDFAVRSSYYFGADTGSAPYTFTVCASGFYTPDFWRGYAVGDTKDFLSGRPYLISGTLEKGSARVAYPGFAAQGGKAYLPVRVSMPRHRSMSRRACGNGKGYDRLPSDGLLFRAQISG
ncbi:MAG: hypothetical protein V8T87_06335 [Victivallales bacterium]